MRTDTQWLSQLWICPFSSIDTHPTISTHEFGVYTLVEVLGKYSPVGGIKYLLPAASRPEKIKGQLSISDDKLWECYDFGAVNIFHMCSLQHRSPGWTSTAWFVVLPRGKCLISKPASGLRVHRVAVQVFRTRPAA